MCDWPGWLKWESIDKEEPNAATTSQWVFLVGCSVVGPILVQVAGCVTKCTRPRRLPPTESNPAESTPAPNDSGASLQVALTSGLPKQETGDQLSLPAPAPAADYQLQVQDDGTQPPAVERASPEAERASPEAENGVTQKSTERSRMVYYDFWRTTCVCLVTITHCSEEYVNYDVIATQQWVLPVLTLISGSLYAKSKQPVFVYSARLCLYFSVGVAWNGLCCVVRGVKWYDNFELIVLFQMAFVLLFIGGALVARPLKYQFQPGAAPGIAWKNIIFYSVILLILGGAQLITMAMDASTVASSQWLRLTMYCIGTAWIASCAFAVLPEAHKGLLGWILILWMYGTRTAMEEDRPGLEFHFVDLYIWGFVIACVPLKGQVYIGWVMARFWIVVALVVAILLVPGEHERVDQHPYPNLFKRLFRLYVPEIICVVAFVAIPAAGSAGVIVFPDVAARHMNWANYWCLCAYVFHWGLYILVGYPCVGIALVYGSMPLFYFYFGTTKEGTEASSPSASRHVTASAPGTAEP